MGLILLPHGFRKIVTPAGGSGNPSNPSFTFVETFDTGGGYDNSWTEAGSTLDANYTTDILEGGQSLRLVASTTAPRTFAGLTSEITKHCYFQIKVNSMSAAATSVFSLRATGTAMLNIVILSDGKLRVQHNTVTSDTSDSISTGVKYHVWCGYTAGSGSNGVAYVAFSTNGVRPNSGTKYANLVTGNGTSNINRVYCGTTSNATFDIIMDRVLIAQTDIYDNP